MARNMWSFFKSGCNCPRHQRLSKSKPSMFNSIYLRWRSMSPIRGGPEFSGSTKGQLAAYTPELSLTENL